MIHVDNHYLREPWANVKKIPDAFITPAYIVLYKTHCKENIFNMIIQY
jgi:hypothetical protein